MGTRGGCRLALGELLLTTAIIAILAAVFPPVFAQVRARSPKPCSKRRMMLTSAPRPRASRASTGLKACYLAEVGRLQHIVATVDDAHEGRRKPSLVIVSVGSFELPGGSLVPG